MTRIRFGNPGPAALEMPASQALKVPMVWDKSIPPSSRVGGVLIGEASSGVGRVPVSRYACPRRR
ncbi:MAG: hypothetical protein K0R62_495 [Nonomuraea muscovyensis]|nr:hypothetical protein [Nonomuraea muscovyensis]